MCKNYRGSITRGESFLEPDIIVITAGCAEKGHAFAVNPGFIEKMNIGKLPHTRGALFNGSHGEFTRTGNDHNVIPRSRTIIEKITINSAFRSGDVTGQQQSRCLGFQDRWKRRFGVTFKM